MRVAASSLLLALCVAAVVWMAPRGACADVLVLANRTDAKVTFSLSAPGGRPRTFELAGGDVVPYPVAGDVEVSFDAGGSQHRYLFHPNSIASFDLRAEKLDLFCMEMAAPVAGVLDDVGPTVELPPDSEARRHAVGTIPVMLLVDDDEPAVRRLWEKRLRKRLSEASDVFERTCRIRFEVTVVGTWKTDDDIKDFKESYREFELKVVPAPARLAIGFTSQYEVFRGQTHLGGTRGPLYSHILIREWSQVVTEAQRLEVLVHELGHYLGAVHIPDSDSVMRPVLTDRRSNAKEFRIGFDPVNTLILYKVCEEIRTRSLREFSQISPAAKAPLRAAYATVQKSVRGDNSAAAYLALLDHPLSDLVKPAEVSEPLVEGTRSVLRAIVAAAESRDRQVDADRLTERYVREAARAADRLPKEIAGRAFILALGLGLDDALSLRDVPVFGPLCRRVETDEERGRRLKVLGTPTMHGRRDIVQHFFMSCALADLAGPRAAENVGVLKEIFDARLGTGFSFVDLAADLSGVAMARGVLEGEIRLASLADSFTVADYLPAGGELPDAIPWETFLRKYGSTADERFQRELIAIRQQIKALPAHADRKGEKEKPDDRQPVGPRDDPNAVPKPAAQPTRAAHVGRSAAALVSKRT